MKFVKYSIIVLIVAALGLFALSWGGKQMRSFKYDEPVAIVASYTNYDCGELCVALKVEKVSSDKFTKYIGLPVYPYNASQDIENYVAENLDQGKGRFCLKGFLHKYNKGFMRLFVVGHEGYKIHITSIEKLIGNCEL
jgi:hypothetical protein